MIASKRSHTVTDGGGFNAEWRVESWSGNDEAMEAMGGELQVLVQQRMEGVGD